LYLEVLQKDLPTKLTFEQKCEGNEGHTMQIFREITFVGKKIKNEKKSYGESLLVVFVKL
jgi:hypothetical protein